MKKQEYTLKDFKIAQKIAIIITLYFWFAYSFAGIGEKIILSEAVIFPLGISCYVMPALLLLCWYMCYERYMYLELQKVKIEEKRNAKHQILLNVLILGFVSITAYTLFFYVTSFVLQYWEYLDKLYGCIVLLAICAFAWLFWTWITIIDMGKMGSFRCKIYKKPCFIGVTILLFVGTLICIRYAYNRGEAEWFYELLEEASNLM